jgi:hypothetical protein
VARIHKPAGPGIQHSPRIPAAANLTFLLDRFATNLPLNPPDRVKMSGSRVDIESIDTLLENIQQSISTLKTRQTEKDRLAALKATQSLVSALHPPKDNVYHLLYSVSIPSAVCLS